MHGTPLARVLALVLSASGLSAQRDPSPPRLILDLDTRPLPPLSSSPDEFAAEGALLWFAADDGVHGRELFHSVGTSASTVLVADLSPGAAPSRPWKLTPFAGRVFFLADDGVHGSEPHCSDGTANGTIRLGDFAAGPAWSLVPHAFAFGTSVVFFIDDGVHGFEPWISDGTLAGTSLLMDVAPGSASGASWGHVAIEVDGRPCIEFFGGSTGAIELWRSDGTTSGTRLVATMGPVYTASRIAVLPDGRSVFWLELPGTWTPTATAWTSDGTAAGTNPVASLPARLGFTPPFVFDGRAFFPVQNTYVAIATDGTAAGTRAVAPGQSGVAPIFCFLGVANGELWGHADSSYRSDNHLVRIARGSWTGDRVPVSNGMGSGQRIQPSPLVVVGDRIVHWTYTGELWVFDPVTSITTRLNAGRSPLHRTLIATQGQAYFQFSDPNAGVELGVSDGTPGGTRLVANIARDDGRPNLGSSTHSYSPAAYGASFATGTLNGYSLWRSDGTAAGTGPVHASTAGLVEQFDVNGVDHVVEAVQPMQHRIFASRGGAPFRQVTLPSPTGTYSWFGTRITLGDAWYVGVNSSSTNLPGVLRVDGLNATQWVTNFQAAPVARLGVRLLIAATPYRNPSAPEPWLVRGLLVSDGTAAGTTTLGKVTQSASAAGLSFVVLRDHAWFLALDGDGVERLASTDGTVGGITLHAALRSGVSDNGMTAIEALDDAILLVDATTAWICDGVNAPYAVSFRSANGLLGTQVHPFGNRALIAWTDRTASRLVCIDAARGVVESIPVPRPLREAPCVLGRDRVLLRSSLPLPNGSSSYEAWITDGTTAGTRPSTLPTLWSAPVLSRGRIFAPAFDPVAGVEPHWSDPGATVTRIDQGCGATRSPTLDALADPILGSTVPLRGRSRAGAVAFLMLSVAPLSTPPLLGGTPCRFHVDPAGFTIWNSHALVGGEFRDALPIPGDPALRGFEVVLQFVAGPTNATLGADLSNGLLLALGY